LINPLYKKKNKASSADGNDKNPDASEIGLLPARNHWSIPPLVDELQKCALPEDPCTTGVLGYITKLEQRQVQDKDKIKKLKDHVKLLLAENASLKEALGKSQEKGHGDDTGVNEAFS
jgi:hypothetical protein